MRSAIAITILLLAFGNSAALADLNIQSPAEGASNSSSVQRMVVGEVFVNTSCNPCYYPELELDRIMEVYGSQLTLVRYHVWWPSSSDPFYQWNPTEVTTRNTFYSNNYTPHLFVDGIVDGGSNYPQWEGIIAQRAAIPSPLAIDISGIWDPNTREVNATITVDVIESVPPSGLRIFYGIIESNIFWAAPNGITYHNQTFRDFLSPENGASVGYTQGQVYTHNVTFTLDNEYYETNTEFFFFVQNYTTKEILQGAKVIVTNINMPLPLSIWYVSVAGNDTTGNGSPQFPFRTIQHGIDVSSSGDTVLALNGAYVERIDFLGKGILVGSNYIFTGDSLDIVNTVIDGDSLGSVVTFDGGEDSASILTGFTIRNGYAQDAGGIFCYYASPIITHNKFENNIAWGYGNPPTGYGGAILCYYSNAYIADNNFANNSANYGAAIAARWSDPDIVRNKISSNHAQQSGGGLMITNLSSSEIRNNLIVGNSAGNKGGGVYCWRSDPLMVNNVISNNTANVMGGGMCSESSVPTLINTIMWDDTAPLGQEIALAAYQNLPGVFTISYSDIEGGQGNVYVGPYQVLSWGAGNIAVDPKFRNWAGGDYHLMATVCGNPMNSPCIDTGDPTLIDNQLDCAWGLGGFRSDMGVYGGLGAQSSVSIEMIPDNYPIVVPAGYYFSFTGVLGNNVETPQVVDVWIMLTMPDNSIYGPLMRFNNVHLSAYQTITALGIRQYVPSFAPLGMYGYTAYCGDYPSVKIDSSMLQFTVVASSGGNARNWNIIGFLEDYKEISPDIPLAYSLEANHPNPFNASTTITYELPSAGNVTLEVYNLLGQKVTTLVNERIEAGRHSITWDASQYSSGIYFYRLVVGEKTFAQRMTLLK